MTKPGESILLGLGALIAFGLIRKKNALGTLNFYPATATDLRFEGMTPILSLGLAVQNTSNQQFTLNSFSGNVYSNNYLVGNVSNFNPVTVAANKQTMVILKIRLSLLGITNDIIRAFQTHNIQQQLQLQAYVNVDGIQAPLNINYTIG